MIMNMNLLFEFEDYQAETSAKIIVNRNTKKINTAMQKGWLTSSAIFVFFVSLSIRY